MAACSPQRFLANNRNVFATAALTPSSVLPVTDQVQRIPFARKGTATVALTGTYTGLEPADYEIEIVDTDVETPRVSTPVFSGVGSGTIGGISASGPQQSFVVECTDAGTETTTASVQIEGVTIKAAAAGTAGNAIRFAVDQSTLTFSESAFSLLEDLAAGADKFNGQGFDWDAAVLSNGSIPSTAHRVAFGADRSNVHLSYKEFVNGAWQYRLVPALTRNIAKGAKVYFVTGGRSVTLSDGATSEIYDNIATAYDLLYALRTLSALVVVDGVVANDRSPTGQAARELTLRTDAHAEASYGSGSAYAQGFDSVTVASDASTQLAIATCIAATSSEHPLAALGRTRWALQSSILGNLGTIVEGVPFAGAQFGLTVPVRTPPGYPAPKGRFGVASISYANTTPQAPICPASLTLGPDAVDDTITLRYTTRPTGDCVCADMPAPNLDTKCLGNTKEGGALVGLQADSIDRLIGMRTWSTDLIRTWTAFGGNEQATDTHSATEADAIANPADNTKTFIDSSVKRGNAFSTVQAVTISLKALLNKFEDVLTLIDAVEEGSPVNYRTNGGDAWDTALSQLQTDIAGLGSPPPYQYNLPTDRYIEALNLALTSAGLPVSGGADANTLESGDGCWRDYGDAAYWTVVGDQRGEYAPAFTNRPYFSSRRASTGGVFATREFAFQLNVRCPEDLRDGDTVVLSISQASWGSTYQLGDQLILPIVAASPHYLAGGVDGDPIQSWSANGTVDGPLAPYAFNPEAPVAYSSAHLDFLLNEGGIPFGKGDRFTFAIEGGHFRWRKNGGDWQDDSPPTPIPSGAWALDAGLSATFAPGNANSFFAGDTFKFRARQPWAVSNLQAPSTARWKWQGTAAELLGDATAAVPIQMIALVHDLPQGAIITLSGGSTSSAVDWTEPLTWRPGIIWKVIDHTDQYLKLSITSAGDGSIQFAWAGVPVTTSLSAEFQKRLDYRVAKPDGNLQGGRFVGRAVSGEVSWSESALGEDDADALIAMLDHAKANNDQPIIFVPNADRADDEVLFARIEADAVEFTDRAAYNQKSTFERRVSARIPLAGVLLPRCATDLHA